ncbi:MAG: ABC transporter substrate-binding protein [Faecousia sp.]
MKKALSLLLVLSLLLLCVGCGGKPAASPTESSETTETEPVSLKPTGETTPEQTYKAKVRIGTVSDMPSACPFGNTSSQTAMTTNSTFDGLVRIDMNGDATEALATQWSGNEDSTVWTFTLRQGVKFHNGDDFTSGDVKFTWEFAGDSSHEGIGKPVVGIDVVDSIETPDDYTVIFHLKYSTPDFLLYAAQKILSRNAVETLGVAEGGSIGTGPYYLASQKTGEGWTIRRYDDYWGEKGLTEEIEFVVITDANSRALTLRAGDVDAILEPNSADLASFAADGNFNIYKERTVATFFLGFNHSEGKATADENVRRAVMLAINRDDIINACFEGGLCGTASYNIITSVQPGFADVGHYEYDPEAARKLLEDNNYENLTLNLTAHPLFIPVAEVIQADLSLVGITVNIREIAQSNYSKNLMADPSAYDMYIANSSSTGGVLNVLDRFFSSNGIANCMFYQDPTFDAMLEEAKQAETYEELVEVFGQLQKRIAEETVPYTSLVDRYHFCVAAPNFYGVELGNQAYDTNFSYCYIVE